MTFLGKIGTFVFVIAACSPMTTPSPSTSAQVTPTQVPPGEYVGIAWMDGGTVILARAIEPQREGTSVGVELVVADLAAGSVDPIPLAIDPACKHQRFFRPLQEDGQLFVLQTCLLGGDQKPADANSIMSVDVTTGAAEPYMALGPLGETRNIAYAVDVEGDRVFYTVGGAVCSGIAVATQGNPVGRLRAQVRDGLRAMSLDDPVDLQADCSEAGRAADPALSPDGSHLAFATSLDSVGVTDREARLAAAWEIVVLDLEKDLARILVADVDRAAGISWSGGSAAVVFAGRVDGGTLGIWSAGLQESDLRLLADGEYSFLAQAENGGRIAALQPVAGAAPGSFLSNVVVIDP